MKILRVLLAVVVMTVLAGCTASTEPKVTVSQSSSAAAPVVETFSLIKYPDGRTNVFILVDEAGFKVVKDQIAANSAKEPNGVSLTRAQAVQVLGSEKTANVDALLSAEKGQAGYWVSTMSKVGSLLHEF